MAPRGRQKIIALRAGNLFAAGDSPSESLYHIASSGPISVPRIQGQGFPSASGSFGVWAVAANRERRTFGDALERSCRLEIRHKYVLP